MGILKNLENSLAGLVEGTFGRVFKSEVRPVEIARKLAREMDEHKSYSLSRTFAPNEFHVFLSPEDRRRLADLESSMSAEFTGYLLEHARRERLALMSRPVVHFETDPRLRLGEFGIQTSLAQPGGDEQVGGARSPAGGAGIASPPESGRTMVHSTASRVSERLADARPPRRETALLMMGGRRLIVGEAGVTLGRSRQCEVMVDDPNVSRAHAEVRPHARSWVLTDLGSTNGTRLNGRRVARPETLQDGDEIEVGTTTLTFALE